MTPMLVTLAGSPAPYHSSRVNLGGGRGPAVDLGMVPIGTILTAIGGVVKGIASGVSKSKRKKEATKAKAKAEAQARAAAAAQKAKTMRLALIAGGVGVAALGGVFLLTRGK